MIPTGSNQEIRGLAPSCIVFLPRICCKMHISGYRVRFLGARARTMITRWNAFSLSSPCLRDMVLQVLQDTQSKKEYFRSKESYLETFLPFVLSIFFFPSPSEGHRTPSILCIYSYKKENIPEQGKKFFSPWKWKFACTFPMNRARCILWIKYLKRLSFELYHWFDRFEAWWWKK